MQLSSFSHILHENYQERPKTDFSGNLVIKISYTIIFFYKNIKLKCLQVMNRVAQSVLSIL